MAVSRELESYSASYVAHLTQLLDQVLLSNPHYDYDDLRGVTDDFRNSEQTAIAKIEAGPLLAGTHKVDPISRYAPFYHNLYLIKYFAVPANAATNPGVSVVLLEKIVRQKSGAYNAHFLKDIPSIDLS